MPKVFISYRRSDSRKDAGRLYDRLVEAFGKDNVFKDVDNIGLGTDFRGALCEAVAACDVELVIVASDGGTTEYPPRVGGVARLLAELPRV